MTNPDPTAVGKIQPGFLTSFQNRCSAIAFLKSDAEAESDGSQPILVAGEEAGLDLPYGCREGICHTCVGELRSGDVIEPTEQDVRICINTAEGDVKLEL